MTWQYWLGVVSGVVSALVLGIFANLLTPWAEPYWSRFITLLKHGKYAQTRQQVKVLQNQLDELAKHQSRSDRDLLIYLTRWAAIIFSQFALAATCMLLARTAPDLTPIAISRLFLATQVFLLGSVITSLVLLLDAGASTEAGLKKRISKLQADINKLTGKLPPQT